MKVPLDGGTPVTIASGLVAPLALAIDAAHVYWVDPGAGSVSRMVK